MFFTPTDVGEASFEITAAKIYMSDTDIDGEDATLLDTNPLTFTIAEASPQVTEMNTGIGPTPIITVRGGTADDPFNGPFEVEVSFRSENYIKHTVNDEASILVQRGVYGFARDEVVVSGAGASVTTRFWEADGAELYYARINPTETSAEDTPLEVEISVPAGVVQEVGTHLTNVASETVTVYVQLDYPPWDVDENGVLQVIDLEFVEEALGEGLEERHNGALYVNTIVNPRTDVNGDLYVDQMDVDLVRAHIPDGGAQGNSDVSEQEGGTRQARSIEPPDVSVWMPNANLRRAVRKALSIAKGEPFTQAQVATLTKLTATKARINDITGLEHATNLTKLDLRNNKISDATPLTGLTKLTELKIGYNNINDVTAFAGLTKLTLVGLAENQISNITALEDLTNLIELWLRSNNISDITPLENLTDLKILSLEDNEISDITALEDLTSLKELWLLQNNISNITALENLTQLTHLDLKDNEISNITALADLTKLKKLWMADNNINDITTLENLTQLTYLNLRDNEISDITPLANVTKLIELWMADNNISDVSPLSNLRKLKQLGLTGNPILDTSPLYSLTQGVLKRVDITVSQYPPWDINEDGSVDATDSELVTAALGQTGADIADPRTDVNGDGTVDQDDLTLVTDNIGTDGGAPSSVDLFTQLDRETLETLDREVLKTYLNTLRAESDGSAKYQRAIALLESVLTAIRPDKTQLLANYPNPFNPETWIPYQLANASHVQIIIYDTRGTVVRRLDLGHQPEGYYTIRSHAAYWDGRNTFGERVASGIYFYQLQTDNISFMRKLLILK